MLVGSHEGWPLTKLEIADGFYTSRSATVRFVIDHFAVAVVLSFAAVGITHVAFWGTFISGESMTRDIERGARLLLRSTRRARSFME